MRVVVDLQSCQSGSRYGGIGRYSLALLKAMVKGAPSWEFIILLNDNFTQSANQIRDELRNLVVPANIIHFKVPPGCASINCNHALTKAAEIIREKIICDLNPDAVHVTSLIEGFHDDIVTSVGVLPRNPPTAVTLYDLIPLRQPKLYLTDSRGRAHYFAKIRYLKNASSLLAISQFSADEAAAELSSFNGMIVNIKAGVDTRFKKQELSPEIAVLRAKYDINRKIVLYTASFDPRKNQTGLIRAFATLPPRVRSGYQLVFIGHSSLETFEVLTTLALSVGLARNEVRFLGRVPDDELVQFYNICDLFVFPPKWEGLGLPALEAMACGAPVIGSDSTSITEVIGYREALFDPSDTASIARKLEQALTDPSFRSELTARGLQHVKGYTWEQTAERALEALKATVARSRLRGGTNISAVSVNGAKKVEHTLRDRLHIQDLLDDQVRQVSYCAAINDAWLSKTSTPSPRQMGWVTTWGTRCGIASYSRNLADAGVFNPTIFASYADEIFDEGNYRVIRCWKEGKEDRLFELENAIEQENPTDLLIQFNYGFFEFEFLSNLIFRQRWCGRKVFVTLHSTVDRPEENTFRLAHLRSALGQATALFVHSYRDVERLADLGLSDNVVLVPQGVPFGDGAEAQPRRLKKIATYGFFLPGKGLMEISEAVAITNQSGIDIELLMVNAEYPHKSSVTLMEAVRERIRRLDISDKVTIVSEYLLDDKSLALLRSADVIVFPYQRSGESSSAAVRMGLASGRPVAVTPLPIFDDVKEATFPLPGCTPQQLAKGIRELRQTLEGDPEPVAAVLSLATRWRRVNDVRNVAKFLAHTIDVRGGSEIWELALESRLEEVPLANGRVRGGYIEATGPGVVAYGPYATLGPGQYRLIAYGALGECDMQALLRVVANGGAQVLGEVALLELGEDVIADALFGVEEELSGVELVFSVGHNADLRISKYEIYRCVR
jgi:glycosyltransferase involved in cell wall biosynthesis